MLFEKLESLHTAQKKMLAKIKSFSGDDMETIPLSDGLDRILAVNVESEIDVPHYDRCAMDGYAVRSQMVRNASRTNPVLLEKDVQTLWVHTGDVLPDRFDAVVKAEDAEEIGKMVAVYRAVRKNENVGLRGEDIRAGELIAEKGKILRPHDLALLRSAGIDEIDVFRKPVVKVVPTGDELVTSKELLKPGKVIESNGLMVSAYITEWGGIPEITGIIPDDRQKIERVFHDVQKYDMIVVTGGTSVGKRDLLYDVLMDVGEVIFRGVALRPGKPTVFAVVDNTPVLGLPGFPTACVASSYLFLKPSLSKMLHRSDNASFNVRLTEKIHSKAGFTSFVRLHVDFEKMESVPVSSHGSGILSSVTRANAYTLVDENTEIVEENEVVRAFPL